MDSASTLTAAHPRCSVLVRMAIKFPLFYLGKGWTLCMCVVASRRHDTARYGQNSRRGD